MVSFPWAFCCPPDSRHASGGSDGLVLNFMRARVKKRSRPNLETGQNEVVIKGKNLMNTTLMHQGERYAIGKADMLISVLLEKFERFDFFLVRRSNDREPFRIKNRMGALGGESIPHTPGQECEHFAQDKIAGQADRFFMIEPSPCGNRLAMVLVSTVIAGQESTRINEDHLTIGP